MSSNVTAFMTFDAKEKQRPDVMQAFTMIHRLEQSAKCPKGQATEGSVA